ncbi:MAG: stage II sporulation protein P [Bacilli bacterium]|nr:stage II sporulation protein P [Bacilli bacterium]
MKLKKIFYLLLIIFLFSTYFISYKVNLNNLPKKYLEILEYKYNRKSLDIKIDFMSIVIKNYKTKKTFWEHNKMKLESNNQSILYKESEPIVYIYNTHTNEEYSYKKNNLYNITPTVLTASYILETELKKLGIESIVETRNVTDTINKRGLSYNSSYKVSREFMEDSKLKNSSLVYFIDIHRDSVDGNLTTTNINNISYAKLMFLLGLENKDYKKNKEVITTLNNYLERNYQGISRGIYEKKGKGVNGVYNQDMNSNVMLIEVGGVDNTIEEVSSSIKVVANMLYDYINSKN